MKTAPKDGTPVLLLINDVAIQGAWVTFRSHSIWTPIKLPSHGCGCCGDSDPEPTAWSPLPKPVEAA